MKTRSVPRVGLFGSALLIMLSISSVRPVDARRCACCVEPGAWYDYRDEIHDYEFEMINSVKMFRVARLYIPADFPDRFKGMVIPVEDVLTEDYQVSVLQKGPRWTLSFRRKDGARGSLQFTLPKTAVRFGADVKTNVRKESIDPGSIYKELRFNAAVWGTGMFKEGNARGTTCLFVIQGYGNACMQSTDFKTWTLRVSGPRASYRFYGAFAT